VTKKAIKLKMAGTEWIPFEIPKLILFFAQFYRVGLNNIILDLPQAWKRN